MKADEKPSISQIKKQLGVGKKKSKFASKIDAFQVMVMEKDPKKNEEKKI